MSTARGPQHGKHSNGVNHGNRGAVHQARLAAIRECITRSHRIALDGLGMVLPWLPGDIDRAVDDLARRGELIVRHDRYGILWIERAPVAAP